MGNWRIFFKVTKMEELGFKLVCWEWQWPLYMPSLIKLYCLNWIGAHLTVECVPPQGCQLLQGPVPRAQAHSTRSQWFALSMLTFSVIYGSWCVWASKASKVLHNSCIVFTPNPSGDLRLQTEVDKLFAKGQVVNIVSFVNQMVSVCLNHSTVPS